VPCVASGGRPVLVRSKQQSPDIRAALACRVPHACGGALRRSLPRRLIAYTAPNPVAANSYGGFILLILILLSGFAIIRGKRAVRSANRDRPQVPASQRLRQNAEVRRKAEPREATGAKLMLGFLKGWHPYLLVPIERLQVVVAVPWSSRPRFWRGGGC
jgi:hypothetical protein